jgi:hypothetical protein
MLISRFKKLPFRDTTSIRVQLNKNNNYRIFNSFGTPNLAERRPKVEGTFNKNITYSKIKKFPFNFSQLKLENIEENIDNKCYCPYCKGIGVVKCINCNYNVNIKKRIYCTHCNGTSFKICFMCGGDGWKKIIHYM